MCLLLSIGANASLFAVPTVTLLARGRAWTVACGEASMPWCPRVSF